MKVTINDIAKHAGVSRSLVSFYLGNPETTRVAAATRQRIDEAVRQLGYRRNEAARSLRMGRSKTIGVLTGGINQPYQAFFAQATMNELRKSGYRLMLGITNYNQIEEQRVLMDLLACQVDGIIYDLHLDLSSKIAGMLSERKFPILLKQPAPEFNTCCFEDSESYAAMAKAFYEAGCQRICFFDSPFGFQFETFKKSATAIGIEATLEHYCDAPQMELIFQRILRERPDGIFTVTGPHLVHCLQERIRREAPDYRPQYGFVHSWQLDRLDDYESIVGAVYYRAHHLVELSCRRLLEMINAPAFHVEHVLQKTQFLSRDELRKLDNSYISDPWDVWNIQF